ncbi:hypothetical protein LEMLEM_LOCUS5852 [Lemmus lemmus]
MRTGNKTRASSKRRPWRRTRLSPGESHRQGSEFALSHGQSSIFSSGDSIIFKLREWFV